VENEEFNDAMDRLATRLENTSGLSVSERLALIQEGREAVLRLTMALDPEERERLLRALEDASPADAAYAQNLIDPS
jgi:hypothetical protein